MDNNLSGIEEERRSVQILLDSQKKQPERNRLGQYSTPYLLADDILQYGISISEEEKVRFLDPAIGTGVFYSALREVAESRIESAEGYDIDPHYANATIQLWEKTGLSVHVKDFTQADPEPKFNLIICNPPYVRHHHISNEEKARLLQMSLQATGIKLSGLAGLYCYFLFLADAWMAKGGVAGWLIPSEFMDVNYGSAIKEYLLKKVTLLHIHRFDPNEAQFPDALVSSAIVWFKKLPPPPDHQIKFTFGGSLLQPMKSCLIPSDELESERKWTRFPIVGIRSKSSLFTVGDLFKIKRGIATGCNSYFILSKEEIARRNLPMEVFRSILPSPRYIPDNIVEAESNGNPKVDKRLYLLDVSLNEDQIKETYPALWLYLLEGRAVNLHERYLCSGRKPWYNQEKRPPAPIVCTYMGRSSSGREHPFRFILNKSSATITNVYLAMYPTSNFLELLNKDKDMIGRVWNLLNKISINDILGEGRVYGGGLHKLEPKELGNVPLHIIERI